MFLWNLVEQNLQYYALESSQAQINVSQNINAVIKCKYLKNVVKSTIDACTISLFGAIQCSSSSVGGLWLLFVSFHRSRALNVRRRSRLWRWRVCCIWSATCTWSSSTRTCTWRRETPGSAPSVTGCSRWDLTFITAVLNHWLEMCALVSLEKFSLALYNQINHTDLS